MRRDDILSLKEKRAHLHKEMIDLFAVAEGDQREFTAEEAEQYDKMEGEFRSLTKRWEQAEELYNRDKEVKKSLETPIELRATGEDEVPLTLAEYRTKTGLTKVWDTPEYRSAYWHYLTAKNLAELDIEEQRVLSKATAGAGANLVPTSFYDQIINILRFTGPINQLASVMTTDSGEALQIPAVSAHGVATWTAENAAYTASDETFGQITLNAFKAARTVIVSEELLTDAAFGLDGYLAQEFGTSIGVLEETAYAVGDGSGKPLGIATTVNGVTVSQAASGNTTSFTYAALATFAFALPYQYRRGTPPGSSPTRRSGTSTRWSTRRTGRCGASTSRPPGRTRSSATRSTRRRIWRRRACQREVGDLRRHPTRRTRSAASTGSALQRQNELYSNNGQVGFRGFERVDGRVRNASAAIVLQQSAT
jgi:HK97 family phage major capsid protein